MSNPELIKAGDRVMVLSHIDENNRAHLIGYGTFDGEHPIGAEAVGCQAALCRMQGKNNPKITLDSGDVVWGAECWFGIEEEIKKLFERSGVQEVIPENIQTLREAAQKCLAVKFYVPPNRQCSWIPVPVSNDVFTKMATLTAMGMWLEGEQLRLAGRYSITVTSKDADEEIELFNSLDQIEGAVEKAINDAYTRFSAKLA